MTTPDPSNPTPPADPAPGTPPAPVPSPPPGGGLLDQAAVDKIIQQRLADQQRKHDAAIADLTDNAGKSEVDRLKLEAEKANTRAGSVGEKAAHRVARAEASVAAITAGGRADRAAAIVKQADLDGVVTVDGDDFTVDATKLKAAIDAVLEDYPEWKADGTPAPKPTPGTPPEGTPPASGGDLNGDRGDATTAEEFARMTLTERTKLATDKPDDYRRLADAEIASKSRRG